MAPNKNEKFMWSKHALETFIRCYECFPELYLVSSKDYKNKSLHELVYKKISEQFEEITHSSISVTVVKNKIHSIKTQYLRESNKVKASKTSGAGAEEVYTPKLWYYSLLKFLDGSSNPVRCTMSNVCTDTEQDGTIENQMVNSLNTSVDEVIVLDPIEDGNVTDLNVKKRKRRPAVVDENEISALIANASEIMGSTSKAIFTPAASDELNVFAQTMANEMRKIKCPRRLQKLKREVMNHIFDSQEEDDFY